MGSNNNRHALARPSTALKALAIAELEKTDLEFTSFVNGLFLDYLGMPKVPSHLAGGFKLFDIPTKVAVMFGTGKVPIVMTHTRDVGRFVVASLALEQWEKRSYIIGDRKTWSECIAIAGKVAGKCYSTQNRLDTQGSRPCSLCRKSNCTLTHLGEPFTITDDASSLLSGSVIEQPTHRPAYSSSVKEHGKWLEAGTFSFDGRAPNSVYLNELFPEIVPLTVEDIMEALCR
ncbi:hypothetical protein ACMFMF_005650 [Clarireedia jacksonii]